MVSLVSSLGRAPRNPRFPYVLFLLAKKPSIRPIICCKFYKYEEKKFIDQNRSLFGKNFSSDTSPLSISIVPFVTKKMAKGTFKMLHLSLHLLLEIIILRFSIVIMRHDLRYNNKFCKCIVQVYTYAYKVVEEWSNLLKS